MCIWHFWANYKDQGAHRHFKCEECEGFFWKDLTLGFQTPCEEVCEPPKNIPKTPFSQEVFGGLGSIRVSELLQYVVNPVS